MRPWLRPLLALVLVAGLAGTASADRRPPRQELNILTAAVGGTYHAMAKDLERLLEDVAGELGVDLDVIPSQGTVQNLVDVASYETVPLAIVQNDVLTYLRLHVKADDRGRRIVDGLRLVLPLHEEEVHVIARRALTALGDLNGKRVAIGEAGSGTSVTARVLMRLARVEPKAVLALELSRAVEALRRGEIDALFLVSGVPSRALRDVLRAGDGFVFVPVALGGSSAAGEEVAHAYRRATIPAGAYPGQAGAVETVAVRSGITTLGPVECDAIARLVRAAVEHLPWLREHGHPKWKDVTLDPATILARPRLSPCVSRALP